MFDNLRWLLELYKTPTREPLVVVRWIDGYGPETTGDIPTDVRGVIVSPAAATQLVYETTVGCEPHCLRCLDRYPGDIVVGQPAVGSIVCRPCRFRRVVVVRRGRAVIATDEIEKCAHSQHRQGQPNP